MEDVDEVSEHSLLEFSARATLFCVACLQYWLKIFKSMHHSCFWALGATKLGPGKKKQSSNRCHVWDQQRENCTYRVCWWRPDMIANRLRRLLNFQSLFAGRISWHAKWLACLILVTYETEFTISGATSVTPPTSPNVAPATKNDIAKFQRKCPKTDETSFTMRGRSDHDPRPFRPWNCQSTIRLATEVTFRAHHEYFVVKTTTFCAPATIQKFTNCSTCTKSDTWTAPSLHLPLKVALGLH